MPSLARGSGGSHSGSLARKTYGGAGLATRSAPKKGKKGGGGFWGGLEKTLGRTAHEAKDFAYNTPAAVVANSVALYKDAKAVQTGHIPTNVAKLYGPAAYQSLKDLQHPLRHPFYNALTVGSLGSLGIGSVARGAGALGELEAGMGARAALREAAFPKPRTVTYRTGKLPGGPEKGRSVTVPASKSAVTRAGQRAKAAAIPKVNERALGKLRNLPEDSLLGTFARRYSLGERKVNKEMRRLGQEVHTEQLFDPVDKPIKPSKMRKGKHAGLAVVDATNNAAKTLDLFAKGTGYAGPQILGGVFTNLAQQGFLAPANLAKAFPIANGLKGADRAAVLRRMGVGTAKALQSEHGVGAAAVNKIAHWMGKVIDEPIRISAFVHEARRAGIKDPKAIGELARSNTAKAKLVERRAAAAAIDFGQLNKTERNVLRRIIWFYPWYKASARYAGHFLAEHPQQSAALAQTGKEGRKKYGFGPGEVPSYLAGSLKFGNRLVNPTSATVLGTPASIAAILSGAVHRDPQQVASAADFLTPAGRVANAWLNHLNQYGETDPRGVSFPNAAFDQLVRSNPQYALLNRIRHGGSKMFPATPGEALATYFGGGPYPRRFNKEAARRTRYYELHPPKH